MRFRNIIILGAILTALGGGFYFLSLPEPSPPVEPRFYVWLIEMEDLQHIKISLPHENESQAFVKKEDRTWRFDDPQKSDVDMDRWGGGIPLLLSGPGANRIIAKNATPEILAEFGLTQPQMVIELILEDEKIINIVVGDRTPDGNAFYVQAPNTNDVALVDYIWFEVLERLVKEPPYVPTES